MNGIQPSFPSTGGRIILLLPCNMQRENLDKAQGAIASSRENKGQKV
jgi:hypothetical protein